MRICTVTGSRADWGLLRPVLQRLKESPVEQQIIATGSHLDPRFGHTLDAIVSDGFHCDHRVPLTRRGDDALSVAQAMADAVSGIAQALAGLRPDILLILGDRYEIFAAAQAALIMRIPVAHIAGGDITEGAFDDAIRHAITKISHLHFTTNPEAHQRVLQLGEPAERVFLTGSPGIDGMLAAPRWNRQRLEHELRFRLRRRNFAITFHPATLDPIEPADQVEPMLEALRSFDDATGLIFTGANADTGGRAINAAVQSFVSAHENACFAMSLGQTGYYSLVEQADLVLGNSSSGLYEAPSLGTPTLDIGIRQQGRLRGPSVRHAENVASGIRSGIETMLRDPPADFSNPYGDGSAGRRIVEVLLGIKDPKSLLLKRFEDMRG